MKYYYLRVDLISGHNEPEVFRCIKCSRNRDDEEKRMRDTGWFRIGDEVYNLRAYRKFKVTDVRITYGGSFGYFLAYDIRQILQSNGITYLYELMAADMDDIAEFSGIGEKRLTDILKYRGYIYSLHY